MKYLQDLNPAQRQGVETTHGPVLVIAGAGSGKTKMLTSRISHLIHAHQVPPHQILAVTFTNKAAGEMRERVSHALGTHDTLPPHPMLWGRFDFQLPMPQIGTFHSVCTRLLRREIECTPFQKPFVIYDDSDQLQLVKQCFERLGISDKSFSPKSFQWAINSAKCQAQEPHEMIAGDFDLYTKNVAKVYALYQEELFKNNAVDFGEIITLTYRVLRDHPELLKKYQNLFQFIHVDEYQDTNRAQYLLIRLLAGLHRNLCVVGDEDQSIYKWRGADIKNILDFEKDYPEAKTIKLEQNYRSTKTIIDASSHVISNNTQRKNKTLWTDNETGALISRYQLSDDRAEAELVVRLLKSHCANEGYAFSDSSIFYRTNAQSRVLEDVLRREKIPYKVIGGLRFYDRKEVKDVLAYFRVLQNGSDSISFKRIINVPQRAIGAATVEKIDDLSLKFSTTFETALRHATDGPDALSAGPKKKVAEFVTMIEELKTKAGSLGLSEFYHELMDRTRYFEELRKEGTEEALSRIENLKEFDSILVDFENMHRQAMFSVNQAGSGAPDRVLTAQELLPIFLESVTLASDQDSLDAAGGTVSLMTLHMSKGLEFPLVFMVGLEEGLFPSIRASEAEDPEDIEEERRLCYVGMTRAKRKLTMTSAVCRRVYGNILYHEPARFFQEIPEQYIEFQDYSRFRMGGGASVAQRETSNDWQDNSWSNAGAASGITTVADTHHTNGVGSRVKHQVYGIGVVRVVEGSDQNAKVTVEFSGRVLKKFVLKYANLEYLSG